MLFRVTALCGIATISVVLMSSAARADDDSDIVRTIGAVTMGTAGAVGLATAITNLALAGRGKRPHLAWRIAAIVAGAANAVLTGLWFAITPSNASATRAGTLGFGFGHLTIVGLNVGAVIWGWRQPW